MARLIETEVHIKVKTSRFLPDVKNLKSWRAEVVEGIEMDATNRQLFIGRGATKQAAVNELKLLMTRLGYTGTLELI